MTPVVVGIFGPMIGSFLNLVIHRVHLRRSIIWPSSSCLHGGASLEAASRAAAGTSSAAVEICRLLEHTGNGMTDPGGWFILAGA